MTINIRTKRDTERKLTLTRHLACRFYIYCLEVALLAEKWPREYSMTRMEYVFKPMQAALAGMRRESLTGRLGPIFRQIVFGKTLRINDNAVVNGVENWMQKPEIKVMIAEAVLVSDV